MLDSSLQLELQDFFSDVADRALQPLADGDLGLPPKRLCFARIRKSDLSLPGQIRFVVGPEPRLEYLFDEPVDFVDGVIRSRSCVEDLPVGSRVFEDDQVE